MHWRLERRSYNCYCKFKIVRKNEEKLFLLSLTLNIANSTEKESQKWKNKSCCLQAWWASSGVTFFTRKQSLNSFGRVTRMQIMLRYLLGFYLKMQIIGGGEYCNEKCVFMFGWMLMWKLALLWVEILVRIDKKYLYHHTSCLYSI